MSPISRSLLIRPMRTTLGLGAALDDSSPPTLSHYCWRYPGRVRGAHAVGGELVGVDTDLKSLHLTTETDNVGNARGTDRNLRSITQSCSVFKLAHPTGCRSSGCSGKSLPSGPDSGWTSGSTPSGRSASCRRLYTCCRANSSSTWSSKHTVTTERPKKRCRPDVGLFLYRVHGNLYRDGHELLYLLRRPSRPLRNDCYASCL